MFFMKFIHDQRASSNWYDDATTPDAASIQQSDLSPSVEIWLQILVNRTVWPAIQHEVANLKKEWIFVSPYFNPRSSNWGLLQTLKQ